MKRTFKNNLLKIVSLIFFVCIAVVALFPFISMFIASLKPSQELMRFGINLRIEPDKMSLENYRYLFIGNGNIYHYWYRNSLAITFLHTVFSLLLTSMVGYSLGTYNFKGKNLIFSLVLFVMMIPIEILMLPLYKLEISFRIINTYWGVILPFVVSPFAVFFFRQYVSGVPKDYRDAGRIDGCSEYGIFFRVMAPLMAPAFGAMAILQAMSSWNSFVWPLIVLRTNDMFTLPIGLAGLITPYGNNYDMLISGSVLSVVPIIILFLFNQKAFISGLTVGGVKG